MLVSPGIVLVDGDHGGEANFTLLDLHTGILAFRILAGRTRVRRDLYAHVS